MSYRIIHIEPSAQPKPVAGEPCNGCGVCCLAEPCPLGQLLSGRRQEACDALRWEGGLYRCGALSAPQAVLAQGLPRRLRWLAGPLSVVLAALAARWIAAGRGCDSNLEVERTS